VYSLLAALALLCQSIEPAPAEAEVGDDVRVVVRSADGRVVPGAAVEVRVPDGQVLALGRTAPDGAVDYCPSESGTHELRVVLPAGAPASDPPVLVIRPFAVRPKWDRWGYVLVCVPAGVVLLWRTLRLVRGGAEGAPGSITPGPSPPDP
jgi:hypothetical protein